jgi:polyribonucleotide nucleotidyltransferase
MYAAGKIPGSFFRREGRPTEDAILTCRLTDRPLRPSFPDGLPQRDPDRRHRARRRHGQPLRRAVDQRASAALMISGIPFEGPIGAVRIAYSHRRRVDPAPHLQEGEESTFELVVAGRETRRRRRRRDDGRGRRHREGVEATTRPAPPRSPRRSSPTASRPARSGSRSPSPCSASSSRPASPRARSRPRVPRLDYGDDVFAGSRRSAATSSPRPSPSPTRPSATPRPTPSRPRSSPSCAATDEFAGSPDARSRSKAAVRSLTKKIIRKRVVDEGVRIDGRGPADLRPCRRGRSAAHRPRLGPVPAWRDPGAQRAHLGMPRMDQMLDTLNPTTTKRYMHHYNMPPWANGETGRVGPKRREIGHGALAERAVLPVVPTRRSSPTRCASCPRC